jgi:hypothetical protein
MLEGAEPIYLHCAGNMTRLVEQRVLIRFDDANRGIFQVVGDPGGLDQIFGMNV